MPLETKLQEEAVRGRRVYALIGDALESDVEGIRTNHVLLASSTVPYERSDEVNEVPTMIDEFERYTNKEVVASVFENYLCRWEEVNDGIEKLVQSGVTAVVQPSGSIRDKEIIKFANATDTVLIFSKTRHFRH